MHYFNTAFSLSMVSPPFQMRGAELTVEQAAEYLNCGDVANVANPGHANTLQAISGKLGVDVRDARGGRVLLQPGDECLVAQVSFPPTVPRETKEYTDDQIAAGKFSFILVQVG